MKRAFVIVLDSVGIGAAPDAADYGDAGANTLAHLASAVGGVRLPCFESLGLGNIPPLLPGGLPIEGVRPVAHPRGHAGAMMELSRGKDTTTGHWEMAGLHLETGFHVFPPGPPSFPPDLVRGIVERTGRPLIGNRAASGTAIIEELGAQHLRDGSLIAYTSADSVLQIAAHEEVVPLPELYRACREARALCNPLHVGRVIARPFTGRPGAFRRTQNRRDFSYPLPEPTILDRLFAAGVHTVTVGKLDDIFDRRSIAESHHAKNSRAAMDATLRLARARREEFVFVNLIDFDMLYGHRRDPAGYARALVEADAFTCELTALLQDDELLVITADHGNDPTFRGTDHTREFVPLLVFSPAAPRGASLGIRRGFFDVAQSIASYFGVAPMPRGVSFHPLATPETTP